MSTRGLAKVSLKDKDYTVEVNGSPYKSGPALLKVIIRESHVDTNATTNGIRNKLSKLDECIHAIGHDIGKFNDCVRTLVEALAARGETTEDLLVNLFKGYKECSDKQFVAYIKRKSDDHDEGNDELLAEELMTNADNKHKMLKEAGEWNAPTPEEEKIIALEAEIKSLKKRNKKDAPFQKHGDGKRRQGSQRPEWMNAQPHHLKI